MSVRRTAAVGALASGAIAIALLILIAVHAMPRGLFVVGLLGIAAVGAWYAIVGPSLRIAGVTATVIGLGGSIWLMLDGRIVDELALILAAVVCSICTRAAFWASADLAPVAPPAHPVLFFNPRSGGGKAKRFGLAEEATRRGFATVELRAGDDLEVLVRTAVADGADALAMAGGDGSQAVVAAVAAELDLPYACIPAGTRNHFACDLGVDRDDVVGALDAFVDGGERRVDLAEVNGRVFVNNVSLGLYASAVQRAGYRDAKIRTLLEAVPEMVGPQGTGLDLAGPGRAGTSITRGSRSSSPTTATGSAGPSAPARDRGSTTACSASPCSARPAGAAAAAASSARGASGARRSSRSGPPIRCRRASTARRRRSSRRCASGSGPASSGSGSRVVIPAPRPRPRFRRDSARERSACSRWRSAASPPGTPDRRSLLRCGGMPGAEIVQRRPRRVRE